MPHDAPESAHSLLAEALLFLNANGVNVSFYRVGTTWLYFVDNVSISEGSLIAKAVALGMSVDRSGHNKRSAAGSG